jgi:hypothetical protein
VQPRAPVQSIAATRRLFEGRGWPGRVRQIAHRIGHLVHDRLEVVDSGDTHLAFRKLFQPRCEGVLAWRPGACGNDSHISGDPEPVGAFGDSAPPG